MRLLALTGVVLIALVGAGTAQALSEPASTKLRALSPAELKALVADIDAQGLNTSGSSNVKTGVGRMQVAAGRLPKLSVLGSIGAVATGSVIVWKIAEAAGIGGFVYRTITGEAMNPTGSGVAYSWIYYDSGSTHEYSFASAPAWAFSGTGSGAFGRSYCIGGGGFVSSDVNTTFSAVTGTVYDFSTSSTATCSANDQAMKLRTQAAMERSVQIAPATAGDYSSPPGGATTVEAGTADDTISDPELEAALDIIDPNPGSAGTAVEEETAEAILDELEPGWAEGILLQPLPNETYTQYITRLQEAGWVGTATSTVLATETPGYGPEAVVRVIATPVGGTSTVYDPLNWPSPAPTIAVDQDITIRYNPDTAPEAPTTATPTTISVPPTTVPGTPALDFSPLTDIDFGCKFPYGFLCYAVDVTETFDVSEDAPRFVFDIPTVNVGIAEFGGGEDAWVVDLEVMDDWAAIWRDIWSVVIVIGAVYLVATRLLGFKAGGDPGAAMDDAL